MMDHTVNSVWVHGSSLGDVNALRSICLALHSRGIKLTLSACTNSGIARWAQVMNEGVFDGGTLVELRKAPLLSCRSANRALEESQAQLLILELLELWPPWVLSWAKRGVKVVVVDGRISARTLWARPLLRSSFTSLSLFAAQTPLDAQRAIYMGCTSERVKVCGDAKLDSLLEIEHLRSEVAVHQTNPLKSYDLIIGCTRPRDERSIAIGLRTYLKQNPESRVLIAPRHLERLKPLLKRLSKQGISVQLYSDRSSHPVTLLDKYGVLSELYSLSHCAIIGGTFFDRGQNLIEAAFGGGGVIFGPRVSSQGSQVDALLKGGGLQVKSWGEAFELAALFLERPRESIRVDLSHLDSLRGAVERQLSLIDRLIFESASGQDRER